MLHFNRSIFDFIGYKYKGIRFSNAYCTETRIHFSYYSDTLHDYGEWISYEKTCIRSVFHSVIYECRIYNTFFANAFKKPPISVKITVLNSFYLNHWKRLPKFSIFSVNSFFYCSHSVHKKRTNKNQHKKLTCSDCLRRHLCNARWIFEYFKQIFVWRKFSLFKISSLFKENSFIQVLNE